MSAPLAVGAAVTVELGGLWERHRGVVLRVAEIRRAATYLGGWAVRLVSDGPVACPRTLVGVGAVMAVEATEALAARLDDVLRRLAATEARETALAARLARAEQRLDEFDRSPRLDVAPSCAGGEPVPAGFADATHRAILAGFGVRLAKIAAKHNVTVEELCGRCRQPAIVRARDEALHSIRELAPERWSYPRLGALFGIDHTTAMVAVRRHEARSAMMEVA